MGSIEPNSDTEDRPPMEDAVMAIIFFETEVCCTKFELEAEAKSSKNMALFVMIMWLLICEAVADPNVKDFFRGC